MAKLRIRKPMAAVIIGATAVVGVAVPAMATREYPGGGAWDYGTTGLTVYSNYYHPNNCHRSSVSVNGFVTRSANTAPGQWSHAEDWQAVSGNKAYWNNEC